jgi:hypothetical protein
MISASAFGVSYNQRAVVGQRIVGGEADEQFTPCGGEISPKHSDLKTGRNLFPFEGFPDVVPQIDDPLPRVRRQRVRVRGHVVGSTPACNAG